MARSVYFFATASDLLPILEIVEQKGALHFFLAGLLGQAEPPVFSPARAIPDLAVAKKPDMNHIDRYLILPATTPISVRPVPQRAGGVRYAVDQMINPASVELNPGGVFETIAVISGRFATASDAPESVSLLEQFRKAVKKHFVRHNAYWVGPSAEKLARAGYRLTAAVGSAKIYDLRLSPPN